MNYKKIFNKKEMTRFLGFYVFLVLLLFLYEKYFNPGAQNGVLSTLIRPLGVVLISYLTKKYTDYSDKQNESKNQNINYYTLFKKFFECFTLNTLNYSSPYFMFVGNPLYNHRFLFPVMFSVMSTSLVMACIETFYKKKKDGLR